MAALIRGGVPPLLITERGAFYCVLNLPALVHCVPWEMY